MNIRTPAACCHKHRSNNEVKWKTLMNTSTLPRSPTSLYIPVAGSKYTTVWWNKHSRTHTHKHTVRESPESWDWIKSSLSFLIFFSWFPAHRKRRGQAQSVPALWGMAQPHWLSWGLKHKSAISCNRTRLGSRCSARTARWGSGKKKIKKIFFLLITTARITGQAWKSLWTCCRSATIVSVLSQDKVLRQAN